MATGVAQRFLRKFAEDLPDRGGSSLGYTGWMNITAQFASDIERSTNFCKAWTNPNSSMIVG